MLRIQSQTTALAMERMHGFNLDQSTFYKARNDVKQGKGTKGKTAPAELTDKTIRLDDVTTVQNCAKKVGGWDKLVYMMKFIGRVREGL